MCEFEESLRSLLSLVPNIKASLLYQLLAINTFAQISHVAAHASTISSLSLAFRQNHESAFKLACAGRDREVRIWKLNRELAESDLVLAKAITASRDGGHVASVNCCLWLDDTLITGGDDRTVRVWPVASAMKS